MIDWDRVRQLKMEVGTEDFDEVVEIFFDEIGTVVAQVPEVKDAEPLAHTLHFLRSSALNLGFSSLAERCKDGETRAESGDHALVDRHAIVACFDASKSEFLNGLRHMKAA